jgi:hypothetical protein
MSASDTVFIASTPKAETRAAEVGAQLGQLGYATAPLPTARKARAEAIRSARRVIILWTADAARDTGIRRVAKQAGATGKLTCIHLGTGVSRRTLGGVRPIGLPRGRTQASAWRRLLGNPALTANPASFLAAQILTETHPMRTRTYPLQAITAILALGLIVGGALYTSDAAFKARADALAAQVQARAAQMMHDS